jgi:membrane protease YdiL (CAAX protease family)
MKPWGYLTTLLWAVLVFGIGQAAGIAALYWWYGGDLSAAAAQPYGAIVITLVTLTSNPIEIVLLAGLAALARWDPAGYFGLVVPRWSDVRFALIWLAVLIAVSDLIIYAMHQAVVPPFEIEAFETARAAGWLPALAFATIIAAPIGEEIIFRGFLFRGWVRSARGAKIAIPIISIIFASLHVQYDIFGMLQILAVGLFLGWVRWRSGSTLLTILCHAALNLESSFETVIKIYWFS